MLRRTIRLRAAALLLVLVTLLASCTRGEPPPPPPPPPDGLVAPDAWAARQADYLRQGTRTLDRRNPESVMAALSWARREPSFRVDAREFTPADLQGTFRRIDGHEDASDFELMRVWLMWRNHGPDLSPELQGALRQRILGFRYWYTDPRPGGLVDHKWFWTENHRIIINATEYLAGLSMPEERFAVTGEPGRVHAARGRQRLLRWMDEKARWGFSEWHSDVYYPEDIQALLLLVEHGEPDISARATVLLDVLLVDLASHQLRGNFGTTHGRSYMKDKSRADDQNTRDIIHFLFGTNPQGYSRHVDFAALMLATGTRYRLPLAIQRLATTPATFTDQQRMGVALREHDPVTLSPPAPPGTTFSRPDDLEFWWDRGAMTAWQVVPLSMQAVKDHELWRTELFAPIRPLLSQSGTINPLGAQHVAFGLRCQINAGLLTQVDTVTWRSRDAMLSSAQDYRPGCMGRQYHAWQATLSERAVVFTTQPANLDRAAANGGQWADDDLYWNGGTMPRTAQSGPVAINVYAPGFPAGSGAQRLDANYVEMTHAFFPTQHFDEVRQVGNWTFGRVGEGYVGLWSMRPTRWARLAPNPAGLTKPYDLVADGSAANVWVTEVGDRSRWESFDQFVGSVSGADVSATERGHRGGVSQGFDVAYASPSQGLVRYASTGPLTVAERPVQPSGLRVDNPYLRVGPEEPAWRLEVEGATWEADVRTGARATRS